MKLKLLCVVTAVAAAACAHGPAPPERAAIRDAQAAIDRALTANDANALAYWLTDDATRTGPSGAMTTRAQWLEQIQRGAIRYVSAERIDTEVRFFGQSAIVTGLVDIIVEKPETGRQVERNRYLRVYAWQDGRWKLAAHQATAIAR